MKIIRGIPLLLLVFWLPQTLLGDGVVIPPTAYPDKVTIPDQRALICWSNGVERLAIETRFSAKGTNFAWVVPLPHKPIIEEATSGVFPTLQFLFRPNIINQVTEYYLFLLACSGLVFLMVTVRRNTPPRVRDTIVSLLVALTTVKLLPCIAMALAVVMPYTTWRVRTGRESGWSILAAFLLVLLLGGMFLPALGVAGKSPSIANFSIVSRQIVGVYDTTTITAKDPKALGEWLQDNGYAMPPGASNVISDYVKRGWVFVATKLRRDVETKMLSSPHPLSFTFQTDRAIYPMELTGLQSTNLSVELFVFGPARAQAKFFQIERCAMPTYPSANYFSRGSTEELRLGHPLLRKWVAGTKVATQLKANLTPAMMARDIELKWLPFVEIRHDIYSYTGALIFSLNLGMGVFVFCLMVAGMVAWIKPVWRKKYSLLVIPSLILGIFAADVFYVAIPKISVRLMKHPASDAQAYLRTMDWLFVADCRSNNVSTLAQSRIVLQNLESSYPELTAQNRLLGGRIHEEDSPGNYILRADTNGVKFLIFDADGTEHDLDRQ